MLTVLCPSRGRPDNANELLESFLDSHHDAETAIWFVLDEDDPKREDYPNLQLTVPRGRPGMTDALNMAAKMVWDRSEIVGFVGDDHRFRTSGWDSIFIDQLKSTGGGLVYANDLARPDGDIPTQIFGSSVIWKALGWMALPTAQHLYLDNAWRVLGDELDSLYYFPDIVIEHMHPAYGKAEWDDGYREVNSGPMYDHDRAAFEYWLEHDLAEDLGRVRLALHR